MSNLHGLVHDAELGPSGGAHCERVLSVVAVAYARVVVGGVVEVIGGRSRQFAGYVGVEVGGLRGRSDVGVEDA